ncbi:MAG: bifunctional metallophosphatase/5'-nucleotidase [Planctomycetes bacterium]|nr:bifunctional metallophosphatase/5'-nucleotidase [Planctomycetota bacterium]
MTGRALLALLLVAVPACAEEVAAKVVILHTNDLHGRVYAQKATWLDKENPPMVGGFAALASTIRRERAKAWADGATVFVVDAGDWFQGTPEGDLPRGKLVVEWMNLAGYDLATIGNHEFDKGAGTVEDLARIANFPFLGANIRREKTGRRPSWAAGSRTYAVGEAKITFIGILTTAMRTLVMPEAIEGLRFESEEKTLSWYVEHCSDRILIPVTHCGKDRDLELAEKFAFPVIIGGHSHSGIPNPKPSTTGCYVCQCFAHGTVLGRVDLTIQGKKVVKVSAGHVPVKVADGEDPESVALIAKYAREIGQSMDVVIGDAPEAMTRNAGGSSPLGNWLCDVMRESTRSQVAFHNRTGIRADLAAGPVRLRDMYTISPFSNTLVTFDLSGADVDSVLEYSIGTSAVFLEVSGLECEVDMKAPEGARVTVTKVAAEPWDATRTYRVVTNSFLAAGGDGHTTFRNGKNFVETGVDMLDAQVEACRKGPVKAAGENRIRMK